MRAQGRGMTAGVLAAWWSYVVADFVIHAVALESWWRSTAEFWLSPTELATRIPFAYAGFAIYCVALVWFILRADPEAPRVSRGLRIGAVAGAGFGVISALTVYSIVRAPASFLLVGPASGALCSAVAGAIGTWVAGAATHWRRLGLVVVLGLVVFVAGVVVQNLLKAAQ